MINLAAIQVQRAKDQLANESSWKTRRWHPERDTWDVRNTPEPARAKPRSRCLAGDCPRRPCVTGRFVGYCETHAARLAHSGVIDTAADFPVVNDRC